MAPAFLAATVEWVEAITIVVALNLRIGRRAATAAARPRAEADLDYR
jgi:hypothetical protein